MDKFRVTRHPGSTGVWKIETPRSGVHWAMGFDNAIEKCQEIGQAYLDAEAVQAAGLAVGRYRQERLNMVASRILDRVDRRFYR